MAERTEKISAELITFASDCLKKHVLKDVIIDDVKVNSFTSKGCVRNDVLLLLLKKDSNMIQAIRDKLQTEIPDGDFSTVVPHVTEGIYRLLEDAERRRDEILKLLPYKVTITGVYCGLGT